MHNPTEPHTTSEIDGRTPERFVVLLVDDQIIIAAAVQQALADEPDIEFHYCPDAKLALATAESLQPTCILQDLVMPDSDGLTLLKLYRSSARAAAIPVIVLSTREEPEIKREAFATGANDYLVKLPDRIELIARIRYHSRGYLAQKQRDAAYQALKESEEKLAAANRQLQKLTIEDGLTGIANRRYFDEIIVQEWRRAMRQTSCISLIMIDIDFFKRYNDLYGHQGGDRCLRQVAAIIDGSVQRECDLAVRYGGEEFAVILPMTGIQGANEVAEHMRENVVAAAIPHAASAVARMVTISLGVASAVPERSPDPACLIRAADSALYRAKEKGRNQVVSFFEMVIE
ncbi:MAG: diguanylate cyclase [Thermodesulfobacteriota bacterium]